MIKKIFITHVLNSLQSLVTSLGLSFSHRIDASAALVSLFNNLIIL